MSLNAQLKSQLRTLKLSGVLETLDLRILECQQNQLGFSEFLTFVLQDEIEKRNQRKIKKLLANSTMGQEKTLEAFDFTANPSVNPVLIRQLATCQFIERGENIFFLGPTGTGKTHLAKAIGHQACRKYLSALFFSATKLFDKLRQAELDNTIDTLLKKIFRADLLIIDDFALKKISQQSAEFLYTIIEARQKAKALILTSNRALPDWGAIFPDPIMANVILDRIAHNAYHIVLKGESYRRNFQPKIEIA